MGSKIVGTGHYLPEKVVTNDLWVGKPLYKYDVNEERGEPKYTSHEWIMKNMGIAERREADPDEYVHHLGARAAEKALESAGMSAEDLGGIVVTTITQYRNFPSTACLVQEIIGARRAENVYDIGAACAAFPLAVWNAHLNLQVTKKPCLVVSSETLRKVTDDTDINAPLFGDGAGAIILDYSDEGNGVLAYSSKSDPFGGKYRWIFHSEKRILRMPEGPRVMKDGIEAMHERTLEVKEQLEWSNEDVDLFVPHQANIRILKILEIKSGLEGKVFMNIEKRGNMSSATNAVAVSEAVEQGLIVEGSQVIVTGVASGIVSTAVGLRF